MRHADRIAAGWRLVGYRVYRDDPTDPVIFTPDEVLRAEEAAEWGAYSKVVRVYRRSPPPKKQVTLKIIPTNDNHASITYGEIRLSGRRIRSSESEWKWHFCLFIGEVQDLSFELTLPDQPTGVPFLSAFYEVAIHLRARADRTRDLLSQWKDQVDPREPKYNGNVEY